MKKIITIAAVFVVILFLTKIANQMPPDPTPGQNFALKGQKVVQCSADEIVLVDVHQVQTRLDKDQSWPDCSDFTAGQVLDFYLSRGDKTHFLSVDASPWWRKAM
jgi:hypothetical protein